MITFPHVPGTKDYLGTDATRLLQVADACLFTFESYGYERIILPIFERADIFLQRSGDEIRRRMYIFRDPKGKELCLRPEMTISVVRAFLERMSGRRLPVRLGYQGNVFRYDKVKEGRYRQFLQAGVEFIGSENCIAADAEVLALSLKTVRNAGIKEFRLCLGDLRLGAEFLESLPVPALVRSRLLASFWRRESFQSLLNRFYEAISADDRSSSTMDRLAESLLFLGEEASQLLVRQILSLVVEREIGVRNLDEIAERFLQRLIHGNSLRIQKEYFEIIKEYLSIVGEPGVVLKDLEKLFQKINVSPGPAFEALYKRIELMKALGILDDAAQLDLGFTRGIEYYTGFIFEIHCDHLGSVSQICGGGRYDQLLSAIGATKQIPAIGFAVGIDRLLLALDKTESQRSETNNLVDAVLATIGKVDAQDAWNVADICRQAGWRVRLDLDHHRIGTVLSQTSDEGIPFVIIVGEDELHSECIKVRDMIQHKEIEVPMAALKNYVRSLIEEKQPKV